MNPGGLPHQQQEVQRLLGRCLLRLQQYEKLMKAILSSHDVLVPVQGADKGATGQGDAYSRDSLGMLVQALLSSYIVSPDRHPPGQDDMPDIAALRYRISLVLPAEEHDRVRTSLRELVDLRNGLAHHFIDQFDLWSEAGCLAASDYLRKAYQCIDGHLEQLCTWSQSAEQARADAASLMEAPAVVDMIINGIAPDGRVEWPIAGIVSALREASARLSDDGWTSLEDAVAFLASRHPEQTPTKYGCRTWVQVLNDSRMFDLQYRQIDKEARAA